MFLQCELFVFKAAQINISTLRIDQIITCNMKGDANSDEATEKYPPMQFLSTLQTF